jgi:uncharacterized membrane protein YqjE
LVPLIDDHVRAVGREVRELARLHGELARVEARDGLRRLLTALFLLGFGVMMGTLVIVALGLALFAWVRSLVASPAAAALVALVFAAITVTVWLVAWRLMRGSRDLLLPRTRAMLWEMVRCRDEPTNSSEKSVPDDSASGRRSTI